MKYLYLLILTLFISCSTEKNDDQERHDTGLTPGQKATVDADEDWNKNQIQNFIREAAMIDKMQIRVGKMAQEKAANESVKIYGRMLQEDHTKSLNQLKEVAQFEQINISDSLDEKHLEKVMDLQSSDGSAFDRKFIRMMIEGHTKDINKFRKAQKSIKKDHAIKKWIDEVLPALHTHRQKAEQLQTARNEDEE